MFDNDDVWAFTDAEIELWLLLAVICLYPVLAECGVGFTDPLQVLCSEEILHSLIFGFRKLGINAIYSLGSLPKVFRKAFSEVPEYNISVFIKSSSRYLSDNLGDLFDACVENIASGEPPTLMLVLSDSRVKLPRDLVFSGTIRLERFSDAVLETFEVHRKTLVETVVKEQHWLMERMRDIAEEGEEMPAFHCAAMCVALGLAHEGISTDTVKEFGNRLDSAIERIGKNWDGVPDMTALLHIFWRSVESYFLGTTHEVRAFNRLDVPDEELPIDACSTILYDESAYYIAAPLFDFILDEMDDSFDPEEIIDTFIESGFLVTEGIKRRYQTKEVTLVSSEGYSERHRMMKFRRDIFDNLGEFSLLDLVEMRGGGDDN